MAQTIGEVDKIRTGDEANVAETICTTDYI